MTMQPRIKTILTILERHTKEGTNLSAKELSEITGNHYNVVLRDLKELSKNKVIKRLPGKGHSYRYKFINWPIEEQIANSIKQYKIMTAEGMKSINNKSFKEKLSESLSNSTDTLCDAVDALITYSEMLRSGEVVEQNKLSELRNRTNIAFKRSNEATTLIGRILTTSELWKQETLGAFFND